MADALLALVLGIGSLFITTAQALRFNVSHSALELLLAYCLEPRKWFRPARLIFRRRPDETRSFTGSRATQVIGLKAPRIVTARVELGGRVMPFAAVHESGFGSAPRRRGSLVEEDSTQRVVD